MFVSTELLRSFVSVGLHLSFSKAAKANGVSQSAISQSIKQLEKDLGIPLFERTTKSVSFTKYGRELFETSVEAFSVLDNGIHKLQERLSREYKSLHLAATDTLSKHFLLPYFKTWQDKELDISLRITNRPSQECVSMIESGEAQLAVVNAYEGLYEHNHLEIIDLAPFKDIFVGGSKYKDSNKIWSIDDIIVEPLLLLTAGASSRNFFDAVTFRRCTAPAFELGSLAVLMDLVEINLGISLVPEMVARDKIKEGSMVEIPTNLQIPERRIVLVRSRMDALTEGVTQFIDILQHRTHKEEHCGITKTTN